MKFFSSGNRSTMYVSRSSVARTQSRVSCMLQSPVMDPRRMR